LGKGGVEPKGSIKAERRREGMSPRVNHWTSPKVKIGPRDDWNQQRFKGGGIWTGETRHDKGRGGKEPTKGDTWMWPESQSAARSRELDWRQEKPKKVYKEVKSQKTRGFTKKRWGK